MKQQPFTRKEGLIYLVLLVVFLGLLVLFFRCPPWTWHRTETWSFSIDEKQTEFGGASVVETLTWEADGMTSLILVSVVPSYTFESEAAAESAYQFVLQKDEACNVALEGTTLTFHYAELPYSYATSPGEARKMYESARHTVTGIVRSFRIGNRTIVLESDSP